MTTVIFSVRRCFSKKRRSKRVSERLVTSIKSRLCGDGPVPFVIPNGSEV